jgi:hypothetical protein
MHGFFGCRLRMTEGEGMAEGKQQRIRKVTASQDDRGGVLMLCGIFLKTESAFLIEPAGDTLLKPKAKSQKLRAKS